MGDLNDLIANVPEPRSDFKEWFKGIAKLLLNNYHIETPSTKYRLTEIEFYYYNENHPDESTYGYSKKTSKPKSRIDLHKEKQRKTLNWFFHYSGIDISIGNGTSPGGILIRGIEKIGSPNEIFAGPLIVQLELLNQGVSVNGDRNIQLKLVKNEKESIEIFSRKRVNVKSGGFENKLYNFSRVALKDGEIGGKIS